MGSNIMWLHFKVMFKDVEVHNVSTNSLPEKTTANPLKSGQPQHQKMMLSLTEADWTHTEI